MATAISQDQLGSGSDAGPSAVSVGGVWFALTATLLCVIAPLLLIASAPLTPDGSPIWIFAYALSVVVGLRYAWLLADGSRRLFELVVWLFTYVFLGLAPLVQLRTGRYPATTPDIDPGLHGAAMAVVAVGVLAFALGLTLAGRDRRGATPGVRTRLDDLRIVALSVVAVLFSLYYVSRLGVGTLFTTRAERAGVENALWSNDTVLAVVKASATLPLVVAFTALIRLREQRRGLGLRGPAVLPWVVFVVLILVMNPISTARYVAGTAALAVITALGAASSVHRTRLFALTLAAGLVLIFPYADLARRPDPGQSQLNAGPVEVLSSGDFDAFDQINNAVSYVEVRGPAEGRQLLGSALFWVPRSVWPSKPQDTGIELADHRGYDFKNLSAPLWAEFFINGGWALLILGMALLGWGVRRLDERAIAASRTAPGRLVLTSIVPFYFIIMLRGSLLQSMAGLTVLLVCGAAVSRWPKKTSPAAQLLAPRAA